MYLNNLKNRFNKGNLYRLRFYKNIPFIFQFFSNIAKTKGQNPQNSPFFSQLSFMVSYVTNAEKKKKMLCLIKQFKTMSHGSLAKAYFAGSF